MIQVCQPDLSARAGRGADCAGCHPGTRAGCLVGSGPACLGSWCGFMKGRSGFTNLVFYNNVTCLVDEGKAVVLAWLDSSKAFCGVPSVHSV